jgi:hypothetical protein
MKHRRRGVERLAGALLIAAGISLFYFLLPVTAALGLFAAWISAWPIVVVIGLGGFLVLNQELRVSLKRVTITLIILILWSMVFLIPLPGDSQGLLAIFLAGIGVFLYRRHYLKRSQRSTKRAQSLQSSDSLSRYPSTSCSAIVLSSNCVGT